MVWVSPGQRWASRIAKATNLGSEEQDESPRGVKGFTQENCQPIIGRACKPCLGSWEAYLGLKPKTAEYYCSDIWNHPAQNW